MQEVYGPINSIDCVKCLKNFSRKREQLTASHWAGPIWYVTNNILVLRITFPELLELAGFKKSPERNNCADGFLIELRQLNDRRTNSLCQYELDICTA